MNRASLRRRAALAAVGVGLFAALLAIEAAPASAATEKRPERSSHHAHTVRHAHRERALVPRVQDEHSDRRRHPLGGHGSSNPPAVSTPDLRSSPTPRASTSETPAPTRTVVKAAHPAKANPSASAVPAPKVASVATAAPTYVAVAIDAARLPVSPSNAASPTPSPSAVSATARATAPSPAIHRPRAAPIAIPGTPIRIGLFGDGVSGAIGAALAGVVLLGGAGSVLTLTRRGSR